MNGMDGIMDVIMVVQCNGEGDFGRWEENMGRGFGINEEKAVTLRAEMKE